MSLLDVHELGARFFQNSEVLKATDNKFEKFCEIIEDGIKTKHFCIVQFLASKLKLELNGHFCVIGGLSKSKSMVLLIDPARHRHKWYWVKLEDLYEASKTTMDSTGVSRGLAHFWD